MLQFSKCENEDKPEHETKGFCRKLNIAKHNNQKTICKVINLFIAFSVLNQVLSIFELECILSLHFLSGGGGFQGLAIDIWLSVSYGVNTGK